METHWHGYRSLAWGGIALFGVAIVFLAATSQWTGAAVMAGFGIAAVALLVIYRQAPALAALLLVVAAFVNAGAYVWDWYRAWPPFDKVLHGYTIFALTLPLGVAAAARVLHGERKHPLWFIIVVACIGITLGALWEVAEWLFDLLVPTNVIKGKDDTITDIIVDSMGALLAGWLCRSSLLHRLASSRREQT